MKKLTRKSLSELAMMLPVVENEIQTSFVGGGAGTRTDPFTLWEWEEMGTSFTKGWVEFSSDTISYLKMDYYSYFSGNGYDDYYNDYYNDEGSTSLYNDTDTYNTSNVLDYDADLVANTLFSNQKDFYYQLKNSGQLTVIFVKPEYWGDRYTIDKNAPAAHLEIGSNGEATIYLTHKSSDSFQASNYGNLLKQELFHLYQGQIGLCNIGKCTSTIEYQENLMNWLTGSANKALLGNLYNDYYNWMDGAIKHKWKGDQIIEKTVNLTKFLEGVDRWYEAFIDYFADPKRKLPEDHPYIQDRNKELKDDIKNMNWREVLEWYGYTVK